MLIATSLAVAALLSAPVASRPLGPSITANVTVAADIRPSLVARVLAETSAVWRLAGILLVWDRRAATVADAGNGHPAAGALAARPGGASLLSVTIGNEKQTAARDPTVKALGWIVFAAGSPQQEVYVSYATALELFAESAGVVGRMETMTVTERETLIGRAMGRALAHELGHYLLRSKVHAPSGLMRARFTAAELFSGPRRGLELATEQQRLIAALMSATVPVAFATKN
jgi:hypothetical protein